MRCIKQTVEKDVVTPLKRHRKIALRATDTPQGHYVHLRTLDLNPHTVREMYLKGVAFPLLLVKHIFVNEDGSNGLTFRECPEWFRIFPGRFSRLASWSEEGLAYRGCQASALVNKSAYTA